MESWLNWHNCSTTLWSVQSLGGSKEVPAGIRVLCMDMALLHGLAADHPEVIAYSAEEGCWHAIMSPFHQGWFGCLYSNLVEQGMGGQNQPCSEELWRNPAFLRGLVQLADGCESKSFRI